MIVVSDKWLTYTTFLGEWTKILPTFFCKPLRNFVDSKTRNLIQTIEHVWLLIKNDRDNLTEWWYLGNYFDEFCFRRWFQICPSGLWNLQMSFEILCNWKNSKELLIFGSFIIYFTNYYIITYIYFLYFSINPSSFFY